jgi:hypothetical protein
MWRLVNLVWADFSEESIAFIFRVEKSESEEPAWAGGWRWRRYFPPKRRLTQDVHGATQQKTAFFIFKSSSPPPRRLAQPCRTEGCEYYRSVNTCGACWREKSKIRPPNPHPFNLLSCHGTRKKNEGREFYYGNGSRSRDPVLFTWPPSLQWF